MFTRSVEGIYSHGLDKTPANFAPLNFIERTASVYPNHLSSVYQGRRYTWAETYARCRQLADALMRRGLDDGATVSVISANLPEMYEAHFGVPMAGCVLNTINTRLDAATISFILDFAQSKVLIVDPEFAPVVKAALEKTKRRPYIIAIEDASFDGAVDFADMSYGDFLNQGSADAEWRHPADEWRAIALNFTSGTTGNPKGVVYHHRGAHLNAVNNIMTWGLAAHPHYLWTLPMFHCNGWCFPWTIAATAGVNVCLRAVRAPDIYGLIKSEKVTHFCGAPIVLNMLANAPDDLKAGIAHDVKVMTAGAAPPASVIEAMEGMGFQVTHVYGLTETYGPSVVCAWHDEWDALPLAERARLKSRQGVRYPMLEGLMVADPKTMAPVPSDGETVGEIMMRGNVVMRGYLKNKPATEEALSGGWFHSGDLAVRHPNGYVEIKDRSKDIIISGGENISSIEVEDVLFSHPAVLEAAVVARPDPKWGETPCAFVTLKEGADVTAEELIAYCRDRMAHFKAPKTIVFGALPKTSTGKVQKFVLRDQAKDLK